MKTTKFTLLAFVLFATTSCMFDGFGIQGNGNVTKENRKISSNFDAIKVSQGIDLYLTQGNEVDLSVEVDENILELLVTEIEGNELKIYFDKNVSRATKKVYLTVDSFEKLRASSGAHVKSEGTFKAENMILKTSSGASMRVKIDSKTIDCSTSSGSGIKVSGNASTFYGNASSGSQIDAEDLIAENSTAKASSGARIDVYASESINAKSSSGGDIDVYGNPKSINKSKSSGGSISKN